MTAGELRLYVNIDHVATWREGRKTDEPEPVAAARYCEDAGADGITVHLREDRRHIQDRDVELLRSSVRTVLNLELATSDDVVTIACRLRPYQATLVPERREEVTTEGGLDLRKPSERLSATIDRLAQAGSRVSLFIDPEPSAIETAAALKVTNISYYYKYWCGYWCYYYTPCYPYYPPVAVSSYVVGSLIIELTPYPAPSTGEVGAWTAIIRGIQTGSASTDRSRIVNGISQAFSQSSDYLGK